MPDSAARSVCVRCSATGLFEPCCSSHDALMCHLCYRLTHFVEVCGCPTCLADGLPRILGERTPPTSAATVETHVEYRVICGDGKERGYTYTTKPPLHRLDADGCGPHRLEQRTVTTATTEWGPA